MTRNKWMKLVLYGVALLVVYACGHQNWKEIASVKNGNQTVNTGTQVRIEPSDSNPVEMPGALFSSEKLKFHGTLLNQTSDITLKGMAAVTVAVGNSSYNATMAGDPIKWMKDARRREIEIDFVITPPAGGEFSRTETFMARGPLYFYLADLDGKCVSNIIAWTMKFK